MAARPQADLDLPGLWVGRRYDRLLCAAKMPAVADYEISICGPGEYLLPTGELLQVDSGGHLVDDAASVLFCAEKVPFPITVRSPRAGDRFQPSGMSGTKLLKDYFVDDKVDRESRQRTPVVCCGKEIIWLAGRRRCEQFRPVVGKKVLKIALLRQKQGVE
jgi:tRNA(Ile)-lysidine synthase